MTRRQVFRQGNHRTSIVILLDYFASVGIQYNHDPINLYLNMHQPTNIPSGQLASHTQKLEQIVLQSLARSENGVSEGMRKKYAGRVKYAEMLHHAEGDPNRFIKEAMQELAARQKRYDLAVEHYEFVNASDWSERAKASAKLSLDKAKDSLQEAEDILEATQWEGPLPEEGSELKKDENGLATNSSASRGRKHSNSS